MKFFHMQFGSAATAAPPKGIYRDATELRNRQLYRVMHEQELWYRRKILLPGETTWQFRMGMPTVFLFEPNHTVDMTREVQELCWRLFRYGAPSLPLELAKSLFTEVYKHDIAWTNYQGFLRPGDPRWNFITGEPSNCALPRLDKPRCGGMALLYGHEDGDYLVTTTIDANNIPSFAEVIRRGLFFEALNTGPYFLHPFPQGRGEPVLIPLIAARQVRYPLSHLEKLPLGYDLSKHDNYRPYTF